MEEACQLAILAYPYEVPEWMPDFLLHLGDYLHEAPQIQVNVQDNFKFSWTSVFSIS